MARLRERLQSPTALAALFLFTVSPRALLISLVPLSALAQLETARAVSVLFLVASAFGVLGSLALPALLRRIRAYGVFHLAVATAAGSSILLYQDTLVVFLLGMIVWVFSAVAFEVSMNLYVMHRVPRNQITRFEPKRILFAVIGYSVGPWLGVYLSATYGKGVPFALTVIMAGAALAVFHLLGLREAGASAQLATSMNPLRHIGRFFGQPRLRLAWLITLARTAWWSTFFVYTPIYAVKMGLSESTGGALVSIGVSTVYTVTLWARLGRRYGFRALCIGGFAATGAVSLLVPQFGDAPTIAAALLITAAFCAASLDGLGHIAYLRAVRPRERETMSGVYATYRDAAQLLPPGIFALVLLVAPLPVVFGAAGIWMLTTAWYSRYLPRRLR